MLCVTRRVSVLAKTFITPYVGQLEYALWGQDSIAFKTQNPGKGFVEVGGNWLYATLCRKNISRKGPRKCFSISAGFLLNRALGPQFAQLLRALHRIQSRELKVVGRSPKPQPSRL